MREGEPLVDPGAVGQRRGIELARREHHLAQLAVDLVAVVVHRREVVVGADLLDLAERLEQRLVIPQPHVVERRAVLVDVGARQLGVAGERALLDRDRARTRARVASMLYWMYGASRTCSFGVTTKRWMASA